MTNRFSRRAIACALLATTSICTLALPGAAQAQLAPYALYRSADENGVDLVRGDFSMMLKEGSIGSGVSELELIRTNMDSGHHQWDDYTFNRDVSGSTTTIRVGLPGGYFDKFTVSGTTYTPVKANGASLTGSNASHLYTYTSPEGTKVRYMDASGSWEIGQASNFCSNLTPSTSSCMMVPDRITYPNLARVDFSWAVFNPTLSFYDTRIASVSSSYGYGIAFNYQTDTWTAPGGTAGERQLHVSVQRHDGHDRHGRQHLAPHQHEHPAPGRFEPLFHGCAR